MHIDAGQTNGVLLSKRHHDFIRGGAQPSGPRVKGHKIDDRPVVDRGRDMLIGGIDRQVLGATYNSFSGFRRTEKDNHIGRPVTSRLMGDPAPGRSALDKRK